MLINKSRQNQNFYEHLMNLPRLLFLKKFTKHYLELSRRQKQLKEDNLNTIIDGKHLRGVSDNEHISHIVKLFASERCIVIAQKKVPEKRDERQALPQLLDITYQVE